MGDMTYKVHLDGYNQLDYWTGKTDKSARREFFYYDETDLMAIRVDGWKMHIGVKPEGLWWNEKYYPNVPYLFNLLMDPMEKMTPDSEEWGYIARQFFAQKLCIFPPKASVKLTTDIIESAWIQIYYRESDLDRNDNGYIGDPDDLNENALMLYFFALSSLSNLKETPTQNNETINMNTKSILKPK
jgi:hypothetical protein